MKVRGFAWAGVATDDFEASLRFFTETLGLKVETRGEEQAILAVGPGHGRAWQYFRSPDGHVFEIKTVPRAALETPGGEAHSPPR